MVVAHADRPDLAAVAVLDIVINNADRKGSHLVLDRQGSLWGFDHGLSFHEELKLRTVLWGWAGTPLPDVELARLDALATDLGAPSSSLAQDLDALLAPAEVQACGHGWTGCCAGAASRPGAPLARRPLAAAVTAAGRARQYRWRPRGQPAGWPALRRPPASRPSAVRCERPTSAGLGS